MKKRKVVQLLGLVLVFASSVACLHPPRKYPGKLGSKVQEYLFFKKGDMVHMVLNQRIHSSRSLPPEIAWVVPTPSVPSSYFEESDSVFKILFHGTEENEKVLRKGPRSGLKIHEAVHVGSYEIRPIEVLDTASGKEINEWLFSNGYSKVSNDGLKYYLKPNACFLAIRVRGLSGRDNSLKPLHVVYKSAEFRPPLKFFANAGQFDAFVYTISKRLNSESEKMLRSMGFYRNGNSDISLVSKLGPNFSEAIDSNYSVHRFFGPQLNSMQNPISNWKVDPLF